MGDASHAELLRLKAELAGTPDDPPRGPFARDAGTDGPGGAGAAASPGGLMGRVKAGAERARARVRRHPVASVALAMLAGTVASLVLLRPARPRPPRPEIRNPAAAGRPRAGGNVR